MLNITADDGRPVDDTHTAIAMDYQQGRITLEAMQARLRAAARPATAILEGTPEPAPSPSSPPPRTCCGGR